jgi:hypothetical protein
MHHRAIVAQVMPGDETVDVLAKYSVEKAPALVVLPPETTASFETYSDSLSGKSVGTVADFVLQHSPEAVVGAGRENGADIKNGAAASKKAPKSLRAQAKELIHKAKQTSLPAVVAYRVGEQKDGDEVLSMPDEVCTSAISVLVFVVHLLFFSYCTLIVFANFILPTHQLMHKSTTNNYCGHSFACWNSLTGSID